MNKRLIALMAGAVTIVIPIFLGGCMVPLHRECCCCIEDTIVAPPPRIAEIPPKVAPPPAAIMKITAEQAYRPIYFGFDESFRTPEAEKQLDTLVRYMKENPDVHITIGGFCDPWGSETYNMTLGEQRATSARSYLVDHGIDRNRIDIASFGKTHLVVTGCKTIECNAPNRRDEFKER